ncbi:MAG: hypothetical protein JKY31_06870 [Rhodobacteraceae bacterium]|nr:hypothetical protein [Paracoccaceae bacterium]
MAKQQISDTDRLVMGLVLEAEKALQGLQRDIFSAVGGLGKGKVDKAKVQKASKNVAAFMSRFTKVTKLQNSKAYDQLLPAVQSQVDWMDTLMGNLLGTLNLLNATKPIAKKDPKKDFIYLIKAGKTYAMKYPSTPKGVGTLLKQIQKNNDIGPDAAFVSILPMAIILWLIIDTIMRGLKRKP